ncbi:MAG: excinuclease ABC subunit A, partial [Chitinophagales bacterium]
MSHKKPALTDDVKNNIIIKGAKLHNLKNVSVAIPRNKLVVVTGVSGSGKSSLTIDTLYAEGQRRYVESLSSYARQFMMRMNKPDVDYIKGISPAIAIEQKVITRSSRSTVGTLTELYDYLRLLFARIGKTFSPVSNKIVKKHEVADIVDFIFAFPEKTKLQILIPFRLKNAQLVAQELDLLLQKGYTRLNIDGKLTKIEDLDMKTISEADLKDAHVLIDRLVVKHDDQDNYNRCADSVQTALYESNGDCFVDIIGDKIYPFSNRFELDGMVFEVPSPQFFNFNSPYGACKVCEGFGSIIGIEPSLVIPNRSLSVYEGAIACWKGEKMGQWKEQLVRTAHYFDFPVHRPIRELSPEQYELLWKGNGYFDGLNKFFKELESKKHKIHYRVMLSRYRGRTTCNSCQKTRLRQDAGYVKVAEKSIIDLVLLPIKELRFFFQKLNLPEYEQKVAKRILIEINNRLEVMSDIGLGYLTLNRLSSTLSGGETQRINLTRSLGSNLTNSMYILDEPSIGLHPRDTLRLVRVLKELRDLKNTVIVVEHEEDVIKEADYIIDMGPMAGHLGGEIIFEGDSDQLHKSESSLTADYMLGRKRIELPKQRRPVAYKMVVEHATQHNLKDITVTFPLNMITVVSGVSGSGKTTLVKKILHPALKRLIEDEG